MFDAILIDRITIWFLQSVSAVYFLLELSGNSFFNCILITAF